MISETFLSWNSSLLSVGHTEVPGKTILFCNGIMNDQSAALESAQTISSALGGREVFVYHNPTTLRRYLESENEASERQTTNLARALARHIHELVLTNQKQTIEGQDACVTVFAHSHGAVVTKQALEHLATLDETAKQFVRVYAFGGATLISNRLASQVHNYVFDADLISSLGHAWEKDRAILYQRKKIAKRMKAEGIDLETAIQKEVRRELYQDLNPILRKAHLEDPKTREIKNARYQRLFQDEKTLLYDAEYQAKIAAYTTLVSEYSLTIVDGTPLDDPEFEPIQKNETDSWLNKLGAIGRNIGRGVAAVGSHILHNHAFSKYAPLIQEQEIRI